MLEGLDRYYFRHHDAVKHMLEHPKHGKLFQDNPESAIFPAFWKNWVSIVPHEKARGFTTSGNNENTDHRPFWDAVQPFLKTEGIDPQWEAAMRTAEMHKRWADEYGETPAMMLYLHYLVPHLMNLGGEPQVVQKSEQQTEAPAPSKPKLPKNDVLTYRGNKVKPGITGWAQVNGQRGETDTLDKMQARIDFDLDYLRNWSLQLDLYIILKTIRLVFKDSTAY